MTSDSYKVIISISHHRVAYEYWQRDGEDKIAPMPNGKWPAPLAFFCSTNGIVVGEDAMRAAHNGTINAFGSYFDLLTEDITYNFGGQNRPLRNILLDASEAIFRDFFRTVLLGRFGALSDNRAHMPLTIVCESDISAPERALLKGMFKDSGYARVRVVEYDKYIERYVKETLSQNYDCDKVVVAWAEGSDLTFTLFDTGGGSAPVRMAYAGLGIDPRKDYVKNQLWTRIVSYNGFLRWADEEDAIDRAATNFLNSKLPMINSSILLSDGSTFYYSLNKTNIDSVLSEEGASIKNTLRTFLQQCGIENRSRTVMLLRGVAADNAYFEQNLSHGFSETIKTDRRLRESAMRLIIADDCASEPDTTTPAPPATPAPPTTPATPATPATPIKDLKKEWRQTRAMANGKARAGQASAALQMLREFLAKCPACPGAEDLAAEAKAEIEKLNKSAKTAPKKTETPTTPPAPATNEDEAARLRRKWRDIRTIACYKESAGAVNDALAILLSFAGEVSKAPGAEDILKSVNDLIAKMNGVPTAEEPAPQPKGKELIRQGRLKEARDWYRDQGNAQMAKLLTDIIRAEKSIAPRRASLDAYRKSKNKDQIRRIIAELQAYIDLCDKAGVNAADYRALLAEYKKI